LQNFQQPESNWSGCWKFLYAQC